MYTSTTYRVKWNLILYCISTIKINELRKLNCQGNLSILRKPRTSIPTYFLFKNLFWLLLKRTFLCLTSEVKILKTLLSLIDESSDWKEREKEDIHLKVGGKNNSFIIKEETFLTNKLPLLPLIDGWKWKLKLISDVSKSPAPKKLTADADQPVFLVTTKNERFVVFGGSRLLWRKRNNKRYLVENFDPSRSPARLHLLPGAKIWTTILQLLKETTELRS